MTLTSEQVDAITCAWLDCLAAGQLPMCGYIDLDGMAKAAGRSAKDLEKAFPFLLEEV